MSAHLTPDELRTLFLFADLDAEKLDWVAEHGDVVAYPAGSVVSAEGAPADCFSVLLDGTMTMSRRVGADEVETIRTASPGVYSGAVQFYFGDQISQNYPGTVRAITDCRFLQLPAEEFGVVFRRWFPMATHLLQGLFLGTRNTNELVGQRERLLALGKLSAGLTHELNNPAAAAVRATSSLRERVTKMRHKLASLAGGKLDAETLMQLTAVQEEAVERLAKAPKLTPLQASDAEDELTDWMDERGVTAGWELAPTLIAAGVTTQWLERIAEIVPAQHLENGLRWVTYAVDTEMLMNEIEDATHRISALVGAAKQYSQLDRAAHQDIDVHDGLDSTLIMLGKKLVGGALVKEYDRTLPHIPAYPAELNQVWTNLIDNAVHAMEGHGTLTLRTARDGECVLIEVGDTGPGVPAELTTKIFEPFFTTKPVGEGTGLGLDISYRIVAQRHGGDLRVISAPGDTRFQVRLPLREPPATEAL